MADLIAYANRDDICVFEQAAIVHAQFESIHPFTDGNGRIGRALIDTLLRRRQITTRVVVPLASAVVARRDDYFDALGAYRDGDAAPLLHSFAHGSAIAAIESRKTAKRLRDLPLSGTTRRAGHVKGVPPRRSSTDSWSTLCSPSRTCVVGSMPEEAASTAPTSDSTRPK